MATPSHVVHPDGSHSLGVTIDGVYHPFVTVPAQRLAHHAERVADLRERAEQGDEDAADVLAQATGETAKKEAK